MPSVEFRPMTTRKLVEEFKSIFSDVLRDSISDIPLAPILIESNFFAIRTPEDQEMFFATSKYLDEFLLTKVADTISFAEDRLALWAREALEFARTNVHHDAFVEIFASRLQYEPVINNLLRFDESGRFLTEYFKEIRIDSAYLGDALPLAFQASVKQGARTAIQPALLGLANLLKSSRNLGRPHSRQKSEKIIEIRKSTSFLNEEGTVPFSERSGRFRMRQPSELDQAKHYRPVMDRAIRKLAEARTFQRIDNKDRILATLLVEYETMLSHVSSDFSIPLLWTYGVEIETRIIRQNDVEDIGEKLDADDLFDIERLLVSHNLFLNCFDQSASLLRDVESSAAIYQRMDLASKRLSPFILHAVAKNSSLVEADTAATILRVVPVKPGDIRTERKGEIAIKFGLLRGLLHAIGGHLLTGIEKVLEKSAVDVTSKGLLDVLKSDAIFTPSIVFFHEQVAALLELAAQAPIYFGYVRNLLAMLGL